MHGLCKRAGEAKAHKHLESGGMHRAVDNDQLVNGKESLRHLAIETTGNVQTTVNKQPAGEARGRSNKEWIWSGRQIDSALRDTAMHKQQRRALLSLSAVPGYELYTLHGSGVVELRYTLLSTHIRPSFKQRYRFLCISDRHILKP